MASTLLGVMVLVSSFCLVISPTPDPFSHTVLVGRCKGQVEIMAEDSHLSGSLREENLKDPGRIRDNKPNLE